MADQRHHHACQGQSLQCVLGVDSNLDGIATDRPDKVANPSLGGGRSRSQKIAEYFNTAAFALPAPNTPYGNSPRNPLIGPGFVNTDISAFKRFAIYEKSNLLFRGEIFNTFNNVNLSNPNATYTQFTVRQDYFLRQRQGGAVRAEVRILAARACKQEDKDACLSPELHVMPKGNTFSIHDRSIHNYRISKGLSHVA